MLKYQYMRGGHAMNIQIYINGQAVNPNELQDVTIASAAVEQTVREAMRRATDGQAGKH